MLNSQSEDVLIAGYSSSVKDYFRLLKPGVMSLVVFSGVVGLLLAPGEIHPLLGFVSILSLAAASGGAASLNMAIDSDIDSIMSRTKNRPIPSGRVPRSEAISFGCIMLIIAFALMLVTVGAIPAFVLAFSALFYVVVYSLLLKRSTDQNIVIGGLAGALPPLIGWLAVSDEFSIIPYSLVLIIFLWTPPHFWALALYRNEDYKLANVPMMPYTRGIKITKKHIFLYSLSLLPAVLIPYLVGFSSIYYAVFASGLTILQIIASYKLLKIDNDEEKSMRLARKIFGFSILWLFLILSAILFDKYPLITI